MTSLNARLAAWPASLLIALTLALAGAAGLTAQAMGLPLPWMIGPLFLLASLRMAGLPLQAPPGGRHLGQWAIGTALGLYFTPPVVAELADHLALVVGVALAALLVGALCAVLTLRLTGVDRPTAFFASMPGGASDMAHLAERWGGAVDRIAAAHALRVLLVVAIVPVGLTLFVDAHGGVHAPLIRIVAWERLPLLVAASLLGVGALRLLRVANAWTLGPLLGVGLCAAQGMSLTALPGWAVNVGQILVGCALGTRFSPEFFRAAPRFMAVACLTALLSILLAGGAASVAAAATGLPMPSLVLAAAPGGVAEMCITAKVLQLEGAPGHGLPRAAGGGADPGLAPGLPAVRALDGGTLTVPRDRRGMSRIKHSPIALDRRRSLGALGVLATAGLFVPKTGLAQAGGAAPECVLIPAETAGPFPLLSILADPRFVRTDITEGQPGVPLDLTLEVVDVARGCAPVTGAAVYIWHCSKDGAYSGYEQGAQGDHRGETWLRGLQLTDGAGRARFRSIYPGWYPGRVR